MPLECGKTQRRQNNQVPANVRVLLNECVIFNNPAAEDD